MNSFPLLILILFLGVLVFSIIRIFQLPYSKVRRITLSSIRIILIFFITIAFFEPSFQFDRLPSQSRTIPVLIDNSKSMSLFAPDSTVLPLITTMQTLNKKSVIKNNRFIFFTFGDSLKKATDSLTFIENQSTFPILSGNSTFDKSPLMIIISDANWSNSVQLSSVAENKSLYYLQLPKSQQHSHFDTDIKCTPANSSDSTHFTCTITGFATGAFPLTVKCATAGKNLYQNVISIKPGNVHQPLDFNVKKLEPGIHILRFQTLAGDSIINEHRYVHTVSKDIFYYRTHFQTPSLDNRFLQLAFSRDSSFMSTTSDSADLLILSDYTNASSIKISSIAKNGLLFFAGTPPCQTLKRSTTTTLITDYSSYSEFNRSGTATLPPISVYRNCLSSPVVRIFAWVTTGNDHSDTIPALFTTNYNNKTALILSLNDFWKWDFYPLVSDLGEENTFIFSRRIVNAVKELLAFQSSSVYTAVVNNEITESDPFSMVHYLPQSFELNAGITVHCTIKRGDVTILDTTTSAIHDGTGKLHTEFNTVASGNYSYSSTIFNSKERYSYSDSFFINADCKELAVTGQNEYIFSDIARPITLQDTVLLERILNEANNLTVLPVKQSVSINRNWLLILLIFATYGSELFLRRRWKLD